MQVKQLDFNYLRIYGSQMTDYQAYKRRDLDMKLIPISTGSLTQAVAPLHSHWLATGDRTPSEMQSLKMFEILGHPHYRKILMNAIKLTWRARSLYLQFKFGLSIFCVGSRYSAKSILIKISVHPVTHPDGHHRAAKATIVVACAHDGFATFRSPVTSSEIRDHVNHVITITLSAHCRIQKSLLHKTIHFS